MTEHILETSEGSRMQAADPGITNHAEAYVVHALFGRQTHTLVCDIWHGPCVCMTCHDGGD